MLSDQVRAAIRASSRRPTAIAAAAKIHKSALSRFVSGERGLSIAGLDSLGRVLGLAIVVRKRRTAPKKRERS